MSFVLAVNASNPGEYLAVCGLIELVSRLDRSATSGWTRCSGLVPRVPTALADICEITTALTEPEFAKNLSIALSSRAAWKAVTMRGRLPLDEAGAEWAAGLEFALPGCGVVVVDHWYDSVAVRGRQVTERDGKSRWKFWAGQQDGNKGMTGLLLSLVDACGPLKGTTCLQDFLAFTCRGRSPFKLDPATAPSSLDRGISANDAEKEKQSVCRPGLELLAAIGISTFFPPRRYGFGAPDRTIGIRNRFFRYFTWTPEVSVELARLCGRGVAATGCQLTLHEAAIRGKEYSYLQFARPAGVGGMAAVIDETTDE